MVVLSVKMLTRIDKGNDVVSWRQQSFDAIDDRDNVQRPAGAEY